MHDRQGSHRTGGAVPAERCGALCDGFPQNARIELAVAEQAPAASGDDRCLQHGDSGLGVEHHQVGIVVPPVGRALAWIELAPQRDGVAVPRPLQPDRHLVGK